MTRRETEMWSLALPRELHWAQRPTNRDCRETLWWLSGGKLCNERLLKTLPSAPRLEKQTGTFPQNGWKEGFHIWSELPPVGLFSPGCPGKLGDSWPASAGSCGCLWWPSSAGVLSASSPASARTPHSGTCAAFPVPVPAWCIRWPVRVRGPISLIQCNSVTFHLQTDFIMSHFTLKAFVFCLKTLLLTCCWCRRVRTRLVIKAEMKLPMLVSFIKGRFESNKSCRADSQDCGLLFRQRLRLQPDISRHTLQKRTLGG